MTRNHQEAEDITAAAFASAFKNRDQFRGESSPQTWLHAIAVNEFRNRRRSCIVPIESIDRLDAKELTEPDLLAQTLERSECCSKIRAALHRIPAMHRRTLMDHFVRGYSVKRMARRYRVPVGTVLSRLFSAKRLLRLAWEGKHANSEPFAALPCMAPTQAGVQKTRICYHLVVAMSITLHISDSVARSLRIPEGEAEQRLRQELAIALYARGLLSLGKASELAGASRFLFADILTQRDIPRHYGKEELAEDLTYADGE